MPRLWPRCALLLARLMDASDVTIALRDGGGKLEMQRFAPATTPAARATSEALLAEVLATNHVVVRTDGDRADIGVPIRFGRTLHGAIGALGAAAFDEHAVALLESCALYAGARISNDGVRSAHSRYEPLASTDPLTGLANRRRFDAVLETEWKRAGRERLPLVLVMIDIDYFKAFNDTYGHPAGDRCLQQVARTLRACAITTPATAFVEQRTFLEESLSLSRAHGNDTQINTSLTTLAELEFRAGRRTLALVYGRDSIRFAEASGRDDLLAFSHVNHAFYAIANGDVATGRRSAEACLRISMQRRFAEYLSWSIQALAAVSVAEGDAKRAARLIGFCAARAGTKHAPRKAHSSAEHMNDVLTRDVRVLLDEAEFSREAAAGAELDEAAAAGQALAERVTSA